MPRLALPRIRKHGPAVEGGPRILIKAHINVLLEGLLKLALDLLTFFDEIVDLVEKAAAPLRRLLRVIAQLRGGERVAPVHRRCGGKVWL